jgi:DNA polymerase-4
MQRLRNLTPLIEQISIDEAFLDVTDLRDRGEEIARHLQSVIQSELDLPCSLGVATNKLIAKIANDVGKSRVSGISPPNAITVVPPGEEAAFLAPLPTQFLWGVGPKTSARLKELNVYTIGDLAAFPVSELVNIFGKIGTEISQHARGIDDRPVITSYEPKSFSQETTFTHDINDEKRLIRVLRVLAEGVGKQLRHEGLSARTVKLKLRCADFTTLTRQTTLVNPTNLDEEIFRAAQYLFSKVWINNKPVRLLGIGTSNFCLPVRQLSLWEDPNDGSGEKNLRLQSAIDKIRERQGDRSIQHGSDVDRDL